MLDNHPLIVDAMVEERQQRIQTNWESSSQPGWLRRMVGQQMIRIGEWIEGGRKPSASQFEAPAGRRIVLL